MFYAIRLAGLSAIRRLRHQPLVTGIAVCSLALGIGVSTAAFSFLDGLFLSPPTGVAAPEQVVAVFSESQNGPRFLPVSHTTLRTLDQQARTFQDTSASQVIWVGIGEGDAAEQVLGEIVTQGYFATLGVRMTLGRHFTLEETDPSAHSRVVVLSHRLWRDRLASDPAILDQNLSINGQSYRVVGVAPRGFQGVNNLNSPLLWLPISVYEEVFVDPEMFRQINGQMLNLVARLAPGYGLDAARRELDLLSNHLAESFPNEYRGHSLVVLPIAEAQVYPGSRARLWRTSLFLMVVGGLLLASGCVNVAILLLVQAVHRAREFSVQLSLGARRRSLVGQLLVEHSILGLLGCAGGLAVAYWIWQALWIFRPPYFSEHALSFAVDGPTLLFAFLAAVVTSAVFGLAAIARALRCPVSEVLKTDSGSTLGSRPTFRSSRALVMLQVSLSTTLLTSAALFLSTLHDSRQVDLGIETERISTISWDVQSQGYDQSRGEAFQRSALERAMSLPGVEAASLAENRPLGGFRRLENLRRWQQTDSGDSGTMVGSSAVDPHYFSVLAIAMLRGRAFSETDRPGSPPVAIVNEELARVLKPGAPLTLVGEELRLAGEDRRVEVVGIAETTKYIHPNEAPRPALFLPLAQNFRSRSTLHVRSNASAAALLPAVRAEIQALDPQLPLVEVGTAARHLDRALWGLRMNVAVLGAFSLLALLLTAIGIYGTTAFAVAQRRRELGLRIALGAQPLAVVGQVIGQATRPLLVGLVLGLAASYGLGRWIGSIFHSVQPNDLQILAKIALVIFATGSLANLIPVLRAVRVDPARALRA